MIYRFYSNILNKILGDGYPYYVNSHGKVIVIETFLYKKEPTFKETTQDNISYHLCSGLKTPDGKYIFEGDIIQTTKQHGQVFFTSGCFVLKDTVSEKAIPLLKIPKDELKIVGNIVENPPKKAKKIAIPPVFKPIKEK